MQIVSDKLALSDLKELVRMKRLNYFLILFIFIISFLIFQKSSDVVVRAETPTETPTVSVTPTTNNPTDTPTPTQSSSDLTATPTSSISISPTPKPTAKVVKKPTPTRLPTRTPTPTDTPTPTPSPTPKPDLVTTIGGNITIILIILGIVLLGASFYFIRQPSRRRFN